MKVVVIGGGIAGVCCAEELTKTLESPTPTVILIAASDVVKVRLRVLTPRRRRLETAKGVENVQSVTQRIQQFDVVERPATSLSSNRLSVVQGVVTGLHLASQEVLLQDGIKMNYDQLCICAGARPKELHPSRHVLTLRDRYSVALLKERLSTSQRVMVVGNGGIALDLMSGLTGYELIWVLKHGHIGEAFFDADTANFLLQHLHATTPVTQDLPNETPPGASMGLSTERCMGDAVGPNWMKKISLPSAPEASSRKILETDCLVASLEELPESDPFNARVTLTNGHVHEVDVVIAAIGVEPHLPWVPPEIHRADDGGLLVNTSMCTNIPNIYAAGDCCTIDWGSEQSPHWFQMRLWTQAKVMGQYAAQCLAGVSEGPEMWFELFTHVTHLLQQKVILLGHYTLTDALSYQRSWETDRGSVYARVLLKDGRLQGAILIGDTELEETLENLILDRLDVSQYGEQILDPDIDHVFD